MSEKPWWQEYIEDWFLPLPAFEIDPQKTALVIVDVMNKGAHPDYGIGLVLRKLRPLLYASFYTRVAGILIPNLMKLVRFFREHELPVIYVIDGPMSPDLSDWPAKWRQREEQLMAMGLRWTFPVGTVEHAVIEAIKPRERELVFNKITTGAFLSTGIDVTLRRMGTETLVMGGMITNLCLETTARDAVQHGYDCCLVEDACVAWYEQAHEATLATFGSMWGMVRSTDQVLNALRSAL